MAHRTSIQCAGPEMASKCGTCISESDVWATTCGPPADAGDFSQLGNNFASCPAAPITYNNIGCEVTRRVLVAVNQVLAVPSFTEEPAGCPWIRRWDTAWEARQLFS